MCGKNFFWTLGHIFVHPEFALWFSFHTDSAANISSQSKSVQLILKSYHHPIYRFIRSFWYEPHRLGDISSTKICLLSAKWNLTTLRYKWSYFYLFNSCRSQDVPLLQFFQSHRIATGKTVTINSNCKINSEHYKTLCNKVFCLF